jgi:YgiT-type zinc finger domain-containing protein
MTCHKCGSSRMDEQVTDLPFKISGQQILVVKQVPACICGSCGETMLSDQVLATIDLIVARVRKLDSELEVVRYAA